MTTLLPTPEPRLLVVGECFIDRYFIGTSTRLSPEAPVPVTRVERSFQLPGGAGNVYENVKALGATVRLLAQPSHYPIKNRLIANGIQIARWDENDEVAPFEKLWGSDFNYVDGLIISDYNKGAFTPKAIEAIFAAASEIPYIFVDSKSSPKKFGYRLDSTFFFPNMKEWREHAEDYDNCPNIVRTMSENGMELLHRGTELYHEPALATNVVSVSGAGDTAIAAFAYEYCRTQDPEASLRFASKACAVVVGKPYTSTASHDEINKIR